MTTTGELGHAAAGAWIDAAERAMAEVAIATLGSDATVAARGAEPPPLVGGAYLQLIGDDELVHVGLCADEAALRWLATRFCGDAAPLSAHDVADAVGELVNMVAGGVKRRLATERRNLQLGLPLYIHGHLQAGERQTLSASQLGIVGGPTVVLVVLHAPRGR